MKARVNRKELRTFGLMIGAIFLFIGWWPQVIHHTSPRWWAVTVGGVLVTLGAAAPQLLAQPHRAWMFLGHTLGTVNTRILLGVIFYGLITPMGIVKRLLNKNALGRTFEANLDTYRVFRQPRSASHLKQQF